MVSLTAIRPVPVPIHLLLLILVQHISKAARTHSLMRAVMSWLMLVTLLLQAYLRQNGRETPSRTQEPVFYFLFFFLLKMGVRLEH